MDFALQKELTPRQVSAITRDMRNDEKKIFFEIYEFSQLRQVYILKYPERLKELEK